MGIGVGDILEKAQVRFLKNLYFLDKSPPGYVARLEFSIDGIEIPIVSRDINWLCKLLDMKGSRFDIRGYYTWTRLIFITRLGFYCKSLV